MNLIPEIAKMLGVEIGEEFKKLVDKSIEDIEQSQIYKNKNKI